MSYYIGIIGNLFQNLIDEKDDFSLNPSTNKLKGLLETALDEALQIKSFYGDDDNDENIYIVIGVIDKGINRIAFNIAKKEKWKVVGIDTTEAKIYSIIDEMDKYIYVEGGFGVENNEFIKNIDVLINIQGNSSRDQTKVKLARKEKKPVIGLK